MDGPSELQARVKTYCSCSCIRKSQRYSNQGCCRWL